MYFKTHFKYHYIFFKISLKILLLFTQTSNIKALNKQNIVVGKKCLYKIQHEKIINTALSI